VVPSGKPAALTRAKTRAAAKDVARDLPAALAEEIDAFLAFLELEKGSARNTITSYERDLQQCAAFLAARGIASWSEVSAPQLSDWIYSLSERDLAVASLARKLSALRMLFRHLVRERRRADDPTELISGPKLVRRAP
jgi:integrase/recombinase XerD